MNRFVKTIPYAPVALFALSIFLFTGCGAAASQSKSTGIESDPKYLFRITKLTVGGTVTGKFYAIEDQGKILYAATEKGKFGHGLLNVYLTDYVPPHVTRLIAGPGSWGPVLSPDAETVAYNQIELDSDPDRGDDMLLEYRNDVYLMDLDGSNKRRLTSNGRSIVKAWSEDGEDLYLLDAKLVYGKGFFPAFVGSGFFKIRSDGTGLKRVTALPAARSAPDVTLMNSTRGAAAADDSENVEIYDHNVFYRSRPLYSTPSFHVEGEWTWTPETLILGREAIVTVFKPFPDATAPYGARNGQCNLMLVDLDRQNKRLSLFDQDVNCTPVLRVSPDGNYIAYRDSHGFIWIVTGDYEVKKKLGIRSNLHIWLSSSRALLIVGGVYGESLYYVRLLRERLY